MLKEAGPRGDYLRAIFHLLYQPIRAPYALIIAPAGIGKTRACAQGLQRLAGRTVYYFVPNHELARQLVVDLKKAGLNAVQQVLGRTAPGMCELDDIAELSSDIASAGLSVQAVLCGNPESEGGDPDSDDEQLCEYFFECKYQVQRLALANLSPPPDQPLIIVLPIAYLASWPRFLPPPDFKIIDESCWQQFVEKSKLQFTSFLEIAKKAPPKTQHILLSITTALGSGEPLLKALRTMDLAKGGDFTPAKSWLTQQINDRARAIAKSASLDFKKLAPLAATRHLVEQLSREIEIDREISHSIAFPDCERPNTKTQIGIYSRRSAGSDVPVMLLDASADAALNSRIFGKIETRTVEARRNAVIYQVRRKSFSRQSILGVDAFGKPIRPQEAKDLRKDIVRFITARLENHSSILVVAQKRVATVLKKKLKPYIDAGRIHVTHFSALRGLNTFEDCDAAIIVGREQPPPGAAEALARAIYWDDPKPLLLGQGYVRMPATRHFEDGSTEVEIIQQHPDPRINGIRRQICERELEQALDRIRLIHNVEPKSVYLLTCTPIEAEITASAKWARFVGAAQSRIGQAILKSMEVVGTITLGAVSYEAVVLPFGQELGRCFLEIWSSPDAGRDGWRDGGGLNGGCFQIELLFGNAPHLILEYRRPGTPGKPSHALVSVRPLGATHMASDGAGDANPTAAECTPADPKSPPSIVTIDPYPHSEDGLQAAAAIALQRVVGPVKIISIKTHHGRRTDAQSNPPRGIPHRLRGLRAQVLQAARRLHPLHHRRKCDLAAEARHRGPLRTAGSPER